jgi:hypothetical protein
MTTNQGFDPTSYQWKNRLLVVFVTDTEDPLFHQMVGKYQRRKPEFLDRDLRLIVVSSDDMVSMNAEPFRPVDASRARELLRGGSAKKETVLVGKDGSVKLRREGTVDLEEIFALIDTMPMRRREMKERGR